MNDRLSKDELSVLIKIIDLGSSRGIFSAVDLSTVGAMYDRLVALVNATPEQDD